MKTKILLSAILTLLFNIASFSQKPHTYKKDNLLFLLRQTEHINQAIKTIEQLQSNSKTTLKTGKAVIIVCGEAVTGLTTSDGEAWVEKLKKYPNFSIVACGLSLAKFNKSEKDLVPGVGFTENGLTKAFELQKAGYLSIEL
jgi:intracellular sulfur oxidation DsrE/DsrF family protein